MFLRPSCAAALSHSILFRSSRLSMPPGRLLPHCRVRRQRGPLPRKERITADEASPPQKASGGARSGGGPAQKASSRPSGAAPRQKENGAMTSLYRHRPVLLQPERVERMQDQPHQFKRLRSNACCLFFRCEIKPTPSAKGAQTAFC